MWTDKQFEALEQKELDITLEEIAAMLLLLGETKSEIEKELIRFYKEYGTDGVVTYAEARKYVSNTNRQRRLNVILAFLGTCFFGLHDSLKNNFISMETKIFKNEFDFFKLDIPEEFTKIKWGMDALSWDDRLSDDINLWWKYVGNDVKRKILQSATIDDVLEQLNKRFTSIENILKRLAITESSAMTSASRQEIFKELGIKKYQYYTQADEITCETCGPMNGLIFPISAYEIGVTAPPIHPNCRCYTVPLMD